MLRGKSFPHQPANRHTVVTGNEYSNTIGPEFLFISFLSFILTSLSLLHVVEQVLFRRFPDSRLQTVKTELKKIGFITVNEGNKNGNIFCTGTIGFE